MRRRHNWIYALWKQRIAILFYAFLFRRYDLFDLFQLMGDDLIACLDADQIHLIQPNKVPFDDVFLNRRHLDLHAAGKFLAPEGDAVDGEQLFAAVYRLSVQGLDDIGLFAVFLSLFPAGLNTINISDNISHTGGEQILLPAQTGKSFDHSLHLSSLLSK